MMFVWNNIWVLDRNSSREYFVRNKGFAYNDWQCRSSILFQIIFQRDTISRADIHKYRSFQFQVVYWIMIIILMFQPKSLDALRIGSHSLVCHLKMRMFDWFSCDKIVRRVLYIRKVASTSSNKRLYFCQSIIAQAISNRPLTYFQMSVNKEHE